MTQTATYNDTSRLQAALTDAQRRIASLEEETDQWKQRYYRLKQERTWEMKLAAVPADVTSPSHKATICATVAYLKSDQAQKDEHGYIRANPWKVGKLAGQSDQTVRDNWKYCSVEYATKRGEEITVNEGPLALFDKKLVKIPDATKPKGFRYETYLKPRDLLYHPQEYRDAIETPRKHGGAQGPNCQKCGGEMIVKRRPIIEQEYIECPHCGETHVYAPVKVNDPLPYGEARVQSQVDIVALDPAPCEVESVQSQVDIADDAPAPTFFDSLDVNLTGNTHTSTSQVAIPDEPTPPAKPSALEELQALPQWVCWRYEKPRKGEHKGKLTKVPYNARPLANNAKASTTDPATWCSYEQALMIYGQSQTWKKPYDGIGFVFNGDMTGIDYDHCIDMATGEIDADVLGLIARIGSYVELSPSRSGLHQIVRGAIPRGIKRPDIEIYSRGRFFTMTGDHLPWTPSTIELGQAALDELVAQYKPAPRTALLNGLVGTSGGQWRARGKGETDEALLVLASQAANGDKFTRLYDQGDLTGYGSQSEADMALCAMLAFWTGGDALAIDRLFRESALMRPKWDRGARAGETYGEGTIHLVLSDQERRAS